MFGPAATQLELAEADRDAIAHGDLDAHRRVGEFAGDDLRRMCSIEKHGEVGGRVHMPELGNEATGAEVREHGRVVRGRRTQHQQRGGAGRVVDTGHSVLVMQMLKPSST